MPWFPDFVGAVELARREVRAAGRDDPVGQYVAALNDGDARVLETTWRTPSRAPSGRTHPVSSPVAMSPEFRAATYCPTGSSRPAARTSLRASSTAPTKSGNQGTSTASHRKLTSVTSTATETETRIGVPSALRTYTRRRVGTMIPSNSRYRDG